MAVKTTSSLKEMASGENSQRFSYSLFPFTQLSLLMLRLPLMLDGPTQLLCRSYNADFRTPAEGSYTLCCDFCATTTRLNQAEDESLLNSVPSVKKTQSKPKLFLKMSATAFSLSLMQNSSLNLLISRQSIPF